MSVLPSVRKKDETFISQQIGNEIISPIRARVEVRERSPGYGPQDRQDDHGIVQVRRGQNIRIQTEYYLARIRDITIISSSSSRCYPRKAC